MTTPDIAKIIGIAAPLLEAIIDGIRDGISDDEIRKRIASPNGVGQKLIDDIRARKGKFDDFITNG